jgi:D-alanyl-lipoteichoic acid acyltransferase DltB (MBOAT superfamily)
MILPVGISFYTFQQIAFIVDCYKYRDANYKLNEYALFVTFFPQLIAGPIVHHKEIMPQIENSIKNRKDPAITSLGFLFFTVGLFKKVIIADNFALIGNPIFDSIPANGLDTITAWVGALAYTFQLYFDFSAYSEMAIGLGLIFGLKLPLNFNSPYKATSIIDFWRRWHITLSTFLRDYLYIALGGNRKGEFRRYINLMLTMLIGGLWHGAGWGFIIWGGLHGSYLLINHAFNKFLPTLPINKYVGVLITFICVVFAWVYFRAENLEDANTFIYAMLGMTSASFSGSGYTLAMNIFCLVIGFILIWGLPHFAQIVKYAGVKSDLSDCKQKTIAYMKSNKFVVFIAIMLSLSLAMLPEPSVFIYFNF